MRDHNKYFFSYGYMEIFLGCIPKELKSIFWHGRDYSEESFLESCSLDEVDEDCLLIFLQD